MPFYRFDNEDGTSFMAHVRMARGRAPAPCRQHDSALNAVCGRMSSKLCDHPAGNGTCDAPICDRHAHSLGSNVDWCERCFQQHQKKGNENEPT